MRSITISRQYDFPVVRIFLFVFLLLLVLTSAELIAGDGKDELWWDGGLAIPCEDGDSDTVCDFDDNCPGVYNPGQLDADLDGIGNVCDPTNICDSEMAVLPFFFTVDNKVYCAAETSIETGDGSEVLSMGHFVMSAPAVTIAPTFLVRDGGVLVVGSNQIAPNHLPTIGSVSLSPAIAFELTTFTCTPGGIDDVDGDDVTLSYAWIRNGSTVSGASTSTLNGDSFDKGDSIVCQVTPNDGHIDGDSNTSNSIVIANSAPSAPDVILVPGLEFENLTCIITSVLDPDPADMPLTDFSFQWLQNVEPYAGPLLTDTHTDDTIPGGFVLGGNSYTCEVVVTDGSGASSPIGSDFVSIFGGIL